MAIGVVHRELLDPAGMSALRDVLIGRFGWFFHTTRKSALLSIRSEGLRPIAPDGYFLADLPNVVREVIGDGAERVVCLSPQGSLRMNVDKSSALDPDAPEMAHLAMRATDLPTRVGLDWSYPYSWNLVETIRVDNPEMDSSAVAVEVAQRSGSVVSYDVIPAHQLLICPPDGDINDPATWIPLVE
jgi:hypothetical protein